MALRQSLVAVCDHLQQCSQVDTAKIVGIRRQIARTPRQQRFCAYAITRGMVMQPDRYLNQALQEFLLCGRSRAPNVLPDFVRVIEIRQIEEFQASVKSLRVHAFILA